MAGVDLVHVPYKGAGPALTDLLSGNIQLMFNTLDTAIPPVKAGSLRAIGVSSAERIADLPDALTPPKAAIRIICQRTARNCVAFKAA